MDLSNVDLEKLASEGFTFTSDQGTISIKIIFPKSHQLSLQQNTRSSMNADTALPKDFPSKEDLTFVTNLYPNLDFKLQIALFQDYYKNILRTNWPQVWKAWCRRAGTERKDKANGPQNASRDYYVNALSTLQPSQCDPE